MTQEQFDALQRRRQAVAVSAPAAGLTVGIRAEMPASAPAETSKASQRMLIVVYGLPGPQGSKSFKGVSKSTGRGVLVESSKKVRPWRQDVKGVAERVRGSAPPMDGALVARMIFTLPKPSRSPKRRRTFPMRKPDLSKLVRSTEDALTDAGVIADDARIVEFVRVAKVFPNEDPEALDVPGARIEIYPLVPGNSPP